VFSSYISNKGVEKAEGAKKKEGVCKDLRSTARADVSKKGKKRSLGGSAVKKERGFWGLYTGVNPGWEEGDRGRLSTQSRGR